MSDTITIHLTVTGSDGAPRVPLSVSKTINAADLRQQASDATKIPPTSLKLIFRGRLIANDANKQAITEYKLEEGSVVHCMGKPASTASAPAATTPAVPATNTATAAPTFSFTPAAPTATATATAPTPSNNSNNPLQTALAKIRSSCTPADYLTAVTTLEKILNNIIQNPMEDKYRQVKQQNPAFQRRLGGKNGGHDAMLAAGFVLQTDDSKVYEMQASAEAWPKLLETQATLAAAIKTAQRQQTATAATAAATTNNPPFVGGMPAAAGGMPGGFPGGMSPDMQQQAADFMANPAQLQAMMQNPMVQNMLRNHPQFANNPMGQQMLEQMMNNPAMLQQVSQMMRDPAMMNRMQSMMQQQQQQAGGFGGTPGGFGPGLGSTNNTGATFGGATPHNTGVNNTPGSNSSANSSNHNQSQQQQPGDEQMTEEEMIAEAIRRSLQE